MEKFWKIIILNNRVEFCSNDRYIMILYFCYLKLDNSYVFL